MTSMFKVAYFCQLGAEACITALLPMFLSSNGLTVTQVGTLSSLRPCLMAVASPFWSAIADALQSHRCILYSSIVLAAIVRLFYLSTIRFSPLLIWFSLAAVFDAAISPIFDAFAMKQLSDIADWGAIRLWGAVGFGLSSLAAGFVVSDTTFGWPGMFYMYFGLMGSTFFSILVVIGIKEPKQGEGGATVRCNNIGATTLGEADEGLGKGELLQSENRGEEQQQQGYDLRPLEDAPSNRMDGFVLGRKAIGSEEGAIPVTTMGPKASDDPHLKSTASGVVDAALSGEVLDFADGHVLENQDDVIDWEALFRLFLQPEVLVFFAVLLVAGMSQGVIETFLYVHVQSLGGSAALCGAGQALACAAEVPVFRRSGRLLAALGTEGTIALALLAFALRLGFYSQLHRLPSPRAVLLAEGLHGFTFAALWAAAAAHAFRLAPSPRLRTTLQGLVAGANAGAGYAAGALLGGWYCRRRGAPALFLAQTVLVVVVLAVYTPVALSPRFRRQDEQMDNNKRHTYTTGTFFRWPWQWWQSRKQIHQTTPSWRANASTGSGGNGSLVEDDVHIDDDGEIMGGAVGNKDGLRRRSRSCSLASNHLQRSRSCSSSLAASHPHQCNNQGREIHLV